LSICIIAASILPANAFSQSFLSQYKGLPYPTALSGGTTENSGTTANCGTAAAQTFSYDPFGNIDYSGSPYSFQPTYSPATNRMTSLGGYAPTYDPNGNLTNDSVTAFTWDANGNAISVNGVAVTYDALGRMAEQNSSGATSQIVYGPTGGKLALMNAQALETAFVGLPGHGTAVFTSGALNHYRHSDWLGSARLTSSTSQTVLSTSAYTPFGDPYAQSGASDLSFTGQNQDTSSGIYDFSAREYNPEGRWPSPDPSGLMYADPTHPQSLNLYAYVQNNPLLNVDPTGLALLVSCTDGTDTVTSIDVTITNPDGSSTTKTYFNVTAGEQKCTVFDNGSGLIPPLKRATFNLPALAPSNPTQPGKQSKSACNAQRVANAIPGATLTGNNTFQGGHEEYGIQVSGADLAGAGFSFYSSPFGNGNGYRTPFTGGHVNGQPGNITVPYAYGETFAGQAHFDVGNASSGFGGFAEHSFVDVLLGTLFGWIPGLHNFLDPGC
jgi:RHS repeat-associated protein